MPIELGEITRPRAASQSCVCCEGHNGESRILFCSTGNNPHFPERGSEQQMGHWNLDDFFYKTRTTYGALEFVLLPA